MYMYVYEVFDEIYFCLMPYLYIYRLFFKTFPRKIGSVGRNKKRRSICANIVATSPPTHITHSNRLKTYLI